MYWPDSVLPLASLYWLPGTAMLLLFHSIQQSVLVFRSRQRADHL